MAFFAKVPGGVRLAVIAFVAVVVQVALAFASFAVPGIGFLHGLNALVVFSVGVAAARAASSGRDRLTLPQGASTPAAV